MVFCPAISIALSRARFASPGASKSESAPESAPASAERCASVRAAIIMPRSTARAHMPSITINIKEISPAATPCRSPNLVFVRTLMLTDASPVAWTPSCVQGYLARVER